MATGEEKNKWDGNLNNPHQLEPSQLFDIQLNYPGKKSLREILQIKEHNLESVWKGEDVSNNRLYYGNNLDILPSLAHNLNIREQVRLIYIDPPFATNKVFKSRSRKDAYHDLLDGAEYLEFLRERLIWLHKILAEDGSIYLHLDTNMIFYARLIMDEIFGRENFRNLIIRRKCNPKNYTRKQYGNISDFILFYTKSSNYVWNRPYYEWTPEKSTSEYPYTEENTGRRYKKVPIHAPGERNGATGEQWRGMYPPPGKHWQYTPKTLDEMDKKGEIYWSANGNPRRKIYLDQSPGIPIQDIWLDVKDAHNQNIKITGYPTEKPIDLMKRIISASSNPRDLILDCFSGSGTTLHAASDLNRSWIGIDSSLEAIKTTLTRFAQGLEPMGDFVSTRQKKTKKQKPLPMFQEIATIKDFELLTLPPLRDDLNTIIRSWQDMITK